MGFLESDWVLRVETRTTIYDPTTLAYRVTHFSIAETPITNEQAEELMETWDKKKRVSEPIIPHPGAITIVDYQGKTLGYHDCLDD